MNSEKKNHQIIFEQQSKFFKSYLGHTPVIFLLHAEDGRFLYANQKATETLGYSLDELLDMQVSSIDAQASPQNSPLLWQKKCERGAITFETMHRRKDGTTFPVEVTANLLDLDGVRYTSSFVQDITERKRVEEALRLTQFSFDKASFGIFRCGSQAQILNVNERACKSLGYTQEELCQLTLADIDPSVSSENWKNRFEKRAEGSVVTFESVHRRKDGTTFPVEISANLVEFQGNKYSISFVRDITTQKNIEEQKAKMETHLQQVLKMEALGTLAGGIAHDFNNILSAINGYAELTKISCQDRPASQKYINQLIIASDRAKSMVKQILTFSKQSNSEKIPIDISRVINEALNLIAATIPSAIEVLNYVKPDLGVIFADETQIHQIVMNLCTNSCHAMKGKGDRLEVDLIPVTLSSRDSLNYPDLNPGKYLKLIVADNGKGMDRSIIGNIFDPYFTTKNLNGGTGMGLSMVHGIVKDHGGTIKVYSEVGVGTTFQIFLPLAEISYDDLFSQAKQLPHGNECILYVDDERLMLEIGKELLGGLGYLVETRASSTDALEAMRIRPEKYDLIVTDITMPEMTGDELAVEIRKIRPDIPIILCSGFSPRIDGNRLAGIGISKVLMKPVILSDLATNVRKVLDVAKSLS